MKLDIQFSSLRVICIRRRKDIWNDGRKETEIGVLIVSSKL